jgi:maltose alpha-D-glucosyltransferase/alpha-amylase
MKQSNLWFKEAVFYELNLKAFFDGNQDGHGDFLGAIQKLDYLKDLGVDCIWLLPFYASPLKDDGYDIADYYSVNPRFGTLEEFKAFVEAAHSKGMRVITDLVLNHTSDQHIWFQESRKSPDSPYRDYYVWSKTDKKYEDARIIFLDTEPSNWSWDEQAQMYYWHRFYASQPDLNYESPALREEIFKIIRFWLDFGIDGFRADAVPYLFEREGTNCENLPETIEYLRQLRSFIDENYPGRILLCEANQWPEDVRRYFGDGDIFQMGFHFPVMPRIYMSIRKQESADLHWILDKTPPIPENCQWCTFLRNHDELTLEMVTEEERQWMWQEYAPVSRMRLNLGIRRRLAPLLDNDQRKIEMANALLFSLPGSPIIYYGDEIGMGDDIWLADRNGVRTPMQWENSKNAGFSTADPTALYSPVISDEEFGYQSVNVAAQTSKAGSILLKIKEMISIRKNYKALSLGDFSWAEIDNRSVVAFYRKYEEQLMLVLINLSETAQTINIKLPQSFTGYMNAITHKSHPLNTSELTLNVPPYAYHWLELE